MLISTFEILFNVRVDILKINDISRFRVEHVELHICITYYFYTLYSLFEVKFYRCYHVPSYIYYHGNKLT